MTSLPPISLDIAAVPKAGLRQRQRREVIDVSHQAIRFTFNCAS